MLPDGIVIAGYLTREDVRDVFVSARAGSIAALPRRRRRRLRVAEPAGAGEAASARSRG